MAFPLRLADSFGKQPEVKPRKPFSLLYDVIVPACVGVAFAIAAVWALDHYIMPIIDRF